MTTTYTCDINANGTAISAPVYGNGTPYYRLKGNNVDYIHKYKSADMWIDTYSNIQLNARFTGLTSDCRGYYLSGHWQLTYRADFDDVGSEGTHTKLVGLRGFSSDEWLSLQTSSDNTNWSTVDAFYIGTNNFQYQTTNYTNGYIFSKDFNSVDVSSNPLYYRFVITGSSWVRSVAEVQSSLSGYHTDTQIEEKYDYGTSVLKSGRISNYSGFSPVYNLIVQEDTYYYTGPYQEY